MIPGCRVAVTWLSRGCRVAVAWLSRGCRVAVVCPSKPAMEAWHTASLIIPLKQLQFFSRCLVSRLGLFEEHLRSSQIKLRDQPSSSPHFPTCCIPVSRPTAACGGRLPLSLLLQHESWIRPCVTPMIPCKTSNVQSFRTCFFRFAFLLAAGISLLAVQELEPKE